MAHRSLHGIALAQEAAHRPGLRVDSTMTSCRHVRGASSLCLPSFCPLFFDDLPARAGHCGLGQTCVARMSRPSCSNVRSLRRGHVAARAGRAGRVYSDLVPRLIILRLRLAFHTIGFQHHLPFITQYAYEVPRATLQVLLLAALFQLVTIFLHICARSDLSGTPARIASIGLQSYRAAQSSPSSRRAQHQLSVFAGLNAYMLPRGG